ncbi:MAG: hypothetical protein Q8930_20715, partial [Bacillota bacterium]|nr:hypothetical protein [Bacillota bacterium]
AEAVLKSKQRQPSFFRLAIFRMTRTSMKYSQDVLAADKAYFHNKGWTDSKYYYKVKLGPLHSLFGGMMDGMIKRMIKKDMERKALGNNQSNNS